MENKVSKEPLVGVGELFRRTIDIFKRNWKIFLTISSLSAIISIIKISFGLANLSLLALFFIVIVLWINISLYASLKHLGEPDAVGKSMKEGGVFDYTIYIPNFYSNPPWGYRFDVVFHPGNNNNHLVFSISLCFSI